MKFCCCTTPCTEDGERKPLLSGENQEPQRNPLQSPLDGYESTEQQAATNTESQPVGNDLPDVVIKPPDPEKPAGDKPVTKSPDKKAAQIRTKKGLQLKKRVKFLNSKSSKYPSWIVSLAISK
ncbi:hypothetical protein ACROYT_G027485 [Oculina patagonica]